MRNCAQPESRGKLAENPSGVVEATDRYVRSPVAASRSYTDTELPCSFVVNATGSSG